MSKEKKVIIVIPARYKSSRFEGKPLAKILGKPMILRVCDLCAAALEKDNIYVATDDKRIKQKVEQAGYKAVMTSDKHLTGTDRIAEVSELVDADIYINVQGDEPIVDPTDILKIIREKIEYPNFVIKGYSKIRSDENPDNPNIIKVVFNEKNKLIYMSRSRLPGSKNSGFVESGYNKAVCIYAFNKEELKAFSEFGRKSVLEKIEDIEILRFLDLEIDVKLVETNSDSLAVDEEDDILKVEKYLLKNNRV